MDYMQTQSAAGYSVELCYGCQETEEGIYHAFETVDPRGPVDFDAVSGKLAGLLDSEPGDSRFSWNHMLVKIPGNVVERIKDDTAAEIKGLNLRVKELDLLITIQKYLTAEGERLDLAAALLKTVIRLSKAREKSLTRRREKSKI